jgi:hypothetical protein
LITVKSFSTGLLDDIRQAKNELLVFHKIKTCAQVISFGDVVMKFKNSQLTNALAKTASGVIVAAVLGCVSTAHAAWEPTKPVEFVVPAGTGGGADQMARLIQGIVIKHKLMKEPLIVVPRAIRTKSW